MGKEVKKVELIAKRNFTDRETGKSYKEKDKIKVEKATGERLLKSPYDVVEEVKKEKDEKEENQDTK